MFGALLAWMLGRGISRPMIGMCNAMRQLASGNFDVVLPGLGRKDEIGEMASAVEELKMRAVAKAQAEAAEREEQGQHGPSLGEPRSAVQFSATCAGEAPALYAASHERRSRLRPRR